MWMIGVTCAANENMNWPMFWRGPLSILPEREAIKITFVFVRSVPMKSEGWNMPATVLLDHTDMQHTHHVVPKTDEDAFFLEDDPRDHPEDFIWTENPYDQRGAETMNKVALQQAATALNNVTTKPKPIEEPAKPKIEEPDAIFLNSARILRAAVILEFIDGIQITGVVKSFGRYSIEVLPDGAERKEIIFKHALRHMRRS
jgi:sRNA-binding regulator protein Hfq